MQTAQSKLWLVVFLCAALGGLLAASVAPASAQQGKWAENAPVPVENGLSQTTAVAAEDGRVILIGGGIGPGPDSRTNQVWAYTPGEDSWTRLADIPVADGISAFGSAARVGEKIYVFGGVAGADPPAILSSLWSYDIASDTWSAGAELPEARFGSAVAAVNGVIYVSGGGNPRSAFRTHWAYDPAKDAYTELAPLPTPLLRIHGAGIEPDAEVEGDAGSVHVLAGGFNGRSHLEYNIAADTWTTRLLVPFGVTDPGVVVVDNNFIYVTGGLAAEGGRTQVYDRAARAWSQGPRMPGPVNNTSAALVRRLSGGLAGGVIYNLGGFDGESATPANYSLAVGSK